MKKILFLTISLLSPIWSHAGTLSIYQDSGGNIGSVILTPAQQVFYDSSSFSGGVSGFSPLTFDLTVGAGVNRFATVGCGVINDTISSVTIGGFQMTKSTDNFNGTIWRTYIYTYAGPPSGSDNISVYLASGISDRALCTAVAFSGVSGVDVSSGTVDYPGAGTSNVTFTTSVGHEALFDILIDGNTDTPVKASGQGQISSTAGGGYVVTASTKATTTPASYTMGWTSINTPTVHSATALRP